MVPPAVGSTERSAGDEISTTPLSYHRGMNTREQLHILIEDLLGDDPRRALIAYHRLVDAELPWIEQRVVGLARRDGWSWARIGRLLGRSRQAVQKRFEGLAPIQRTDPRAEARHREAEFVRLLRGVGSEPDPVAW